MTDRWMRLDDLETEQPEARCFLSTLHTNGDFGYRLYEVSKDGKVIGYRYELVEIKPAEHLSFSGVFKDKEDCYNTLTVAVHSLYEGSSYETPPGMAADARIAGKRLKEKNK